MRQNDRSPAAIYTMGIAGLFLAGFFLLVIFGAQTYRDAAAGQTGNNQTRALLCYLATCAQSNDAAGAVTVSGEEDAPVLVIADGDSGYALRIYQHEGMLLEDYGQIEEELNPELALAIGETALFQIEEQSGDIFAVTTDAGTVLFHIRSGGGVGR